MWKILNNNFKKTNYLGGNLEQYKSFENKIIYSESTFQM